MTKYYELDMENLKDAEFEITIGSKGDKYKGINMNNDWFYDILRFCNYVDTLYEIGSWKDEYKMLKYHLEDIIEGEEKYSSNEIANEYILKKSCYLLDIINRDGSKEDIQNYICGMKWEWSDIVIIYNLVKFEKGAKMNKEQIETIKRDSQSKLQSLQNEYQEKSNEMINQLKIIREEYEKKRNILKDVKPSSYYNYKFKTEGMKKDNEKINVLVNANYTDKEKTAIYENYILSSTNTTYPLLKKSGIDIDEYMKYLQQDFKSDKKDNGTTSGKTVAGSAKRKTYEYVNSMNISYEQKLLLLGTQYKLNNEERTKLYDYVKTLDYSQEEMQKVFEKLQGFTVYKDGRVTW